MKHRMKRSFNLPQKVMLMEEMKGPCSTVPEIEMRLKPRLQILWIPSRIIRYPLRNTGLVLDPYQ